MFPQAPTRQWVSSLYFRNRLLDFLVTRTKTFRDQPPANYDPLIYRFYELVNVYGTTFKALIHEEFGDGIMSAIDFNMDLTREPDPKGDRVKIVMSGKFLPYKTYLRVPSSRLLVELDE